MKDFLNKFNIFDIFSILLPGIIVLSAQWVLLPLKHKIEITSYFTEARYFFFLVCAYFVGIVLHEINRFVDPLWHKIFYNGNLREILICEQKRGKLIKNPETASLIDKHKERILSTSLLDENVKSIESKSSYIFSYMLNYLEINGCISKSEKMTTIAEMSSSILNGFIIIAILNFILGSIYNCFCNHIYIIAEFAILLAIPLMMARKKRYEQFRVSNLIRTYDILQREKENISK